MEDFHGHNVYGHPVEAAKAYVVACKMLKRQTKHGLPDDWEEQSELLYGILENYTIWIQHRDTYQTVWMDGEPQVEITGHIPLDIAPPPGFDRVVYQFTLDRLVKIDGEFWIKDWKFYKSFSNADLDYDAQLSAYIWAAQCIYEEPIVGGILAEFRKELPKPPRILLSGDISTAQNQKTTHGLYREALLLKYGDVNDASSKHLERLNDLALRETEDRDDFIKRSRTLRTQTQIQSEGTKILMEAQEMCNPDLPLYPNMTRDCSWDCSFRDVCLMVDRDDDWEFTLMDTTVERKEETSTWRQHLPKP